VRYDSLMLGAGDECVEAAMAVIEGAWARNSCLSTCAKRDVILEGTLLAVVPSALANLGNQRTPQDKSSR
jgi:hypothetical protein